MHLYAMKSSLTGMVKIGRSKAPSERLWYLMEQGNAVGLDLDIALLGHIPLINVSNETKVHWALSHARVHGEWFLGCDGAVIRFVNDVIVEKRISLNDWLARAALRRAYADGLRPSTESNPADGLSVRQFAHAVGVSHVAVLKAIKAGRFVTSVGETAEGKPVIANVALARAEWNRTSRNE